MLDKRRVSDVGPEQTKLIERLFGDPNRRLHNLSIFAGERRCTAEELCAEINKAMDAVANGTAVASKHPVESDVPQTDVRDFVRTLGQLTHD